MNNFAQVWFVTGLQQRLLFYLRCFNYLFLNIIASNILLNGSKWSRKPNTLSFLDNMLSAAVRKKQRKVSNVTYYFHHLNSLFFITEYQFFLSYLTNLIFNNLEICIISLLKVRASIEKTLFTWNIRRVPTKYLFPKNACRILIKRSFHSICCSRLTQKSSFHLKY